MITPDKIKELLETYDEVVIDIYGYTAVEKARIQRILFDNGYRWVTGKSDIKFESSYIYIYYSHKHMGLMMISTGTGYKNWCKVNHILIKGSDIVNRNTNHIDEMMNKIMKDLGL